jgi:hypothetical protein
MGERAEGPLLSEAIEAATDDPHLHLGLSPFKVRSQPFVTFATFCSNSLRTFCEWVNELKGRWSAKALEAATDDLDLDLD